MLVKLTPGQLVTEASKNFGMKRFVPISDIENFDPEEVICYNININVFKSNLNIFCSDSERINL